MKRIMILVVTGLLLYACNSDNSENPTPKKNDDNNGGDPIVVVLEDTISRTWQVVEATHNGAADNSSKGLKLNMRKDGSYTLLSTGYVGTWEFMNEKTQVLLDKDQSQYKTTWTIDSISSLYLKVHFKSPFTGGNAVWTMRP